MSRGSGGFELAGCRCATLTCSSAKLSETLEALATRCSTLRRTPLPCPPTETRASRWISRRRIRTLACRASSPLSTRTRSASITPRTCTATTRGVGSRACPPSPRRRSTTRSASEPVSSAVGHLPPTTALPRAQEHRQVARSSPRDSPARRASESPSPLLSKCRLKKCDFADAA